MALNERQLNERQLKILQVIAAGHTTGEAIVDALGSSMQMLSHHINQMVDSGYLKAAKVYDNERQDFIIVRAYLTPEGKSLLEESGEASPVVDAPAIEATQPIAIVRDPENGKTDYALVDDAITKLAAIVDDLPGDWRDLTAVYLEDLQNEINISYRRRPLHIRAYFLAVLRALLPIVAKIPQRDAFLTQVRLLSQQLDIPVKLPD
jgi:DeoR family transcriptional regulator, catabolite repression regulator